MHNFFMILKRNSGQLPSLANQTLGLDLVLQLEMGLRCHFGQGLEIRKFEHSTDLSKHVWQLKRKSEEFKIKWSVKKRA